MDLGLLLLRAVVGLTLAAHGAQKLFGWFGGYGVAGTGAFLETLGFVPGARHARAAGAAEVGAGLLLAFGLMTPLAAAITTSVMLVAAITVHLRGGFFVPTGYEYNLILGAAALATAFTGPGAFSVDHALGLTLDGTGWGLAALVVGVAGALVQLSGRRTTPPAEVANVS